MEDLGNVTGSVFPTEQGGVRFYWPLAENQLTIEVEPRGRSTSTPPTWQRELSKTKRCPRTLI